MENTAQIQKQEALQLTSLLDTFEEIFNTFEGIINLTEKDFNSFGYVKSIEYLIEEALVGDTAEIENENFAQWKCKYWDMLEAYEGNLIAMNKFVEQEQVVKDE